VSLLIAYVILAIGVSFLCSILEAVLLSTTPAYVRSALSTSPLAGRRLDALKRNVDEPLAAILTLNTVAHTVGAAGVGAQAQIVFQNVPLSVISGILTLLILLLSEIIPKTLGALYWRQLALPAAFFLQGLTWLLWPFVKFSSFVSSFLGKSDAGHISRDELLAMTELGIGEGVLDEADAKTLRATLNFATMKAHHVMTPRTVVTFFQATDTVQSVIDHTTAGNYSRYPILENYENILGYVRRDDLLLAAAKNGAQESVQKHMLPALIFPEQIRLKQAMQRLLKEHEQMAIIVDEFGSFAGVLTLEDILETLIGQEIMDESDKVADLRDFAKKRNPGFD
jgi:CBS domain containing-hemolysin-like protein